VSIQNLLQRNRKTFPLQRGASLVLFPLCRLTYADAAPRRLKPTSSPQQYEFVPHPPTFLSLTFARVAHEHQETPFMRQNRFADLSFDLLFQRIPTPGMLETRATLPTVPRPLSLRLFTPVRGTALCPRSTSNDKVPLLLCGFFLFCGIPHLLSSDAPIRPPPPWAARAPFRRGLMAVVPPPCPFRKDPFL